MFLFCGERTWLSVFTEPKKDNIHENLFKGIPPTNSSLPTFHEPRDGEKKSCSTFVCIGTIIKGFEAAALRERPYDCDVGILTVKMVVYIGKAIVDDITYISSHLMVVSTESTSQLSNRNLLQM